MSMFDLPEYNAAFFILLYSSLPFVICEGCLILLGSGAFYLQISFYQRRKTTRLNDLGINRDRWPKVDVMIPCFREPVEVKCGQIWKMALVFLLNLMAYLLKGYRTYCAGCIGD